jgi:hypothetical protein
VTLLSDRQRHITTLIESTAASREEGIPHRQVELYTDITELLGFKNKSNLAGDMKAEHRVLNSAISYL